MNNKQINAVIITAIVLLLALIGFLGVYLMKNQSGSEYEKELAQALKYFEGADYENAVISYEEILRKDDKNEAAYEGVAKSYAAKNDYDSAVYWLTTGVEKTGSQNLRLMLADYQTINNQAGIEEVYEISNVISGSQSVNIASNTLNVLKSQTYGYYVQNYTFSEASTDLKKIINEIPVILNFSSPPSEESRPDSASVTDMGTLFENFTSGVSFERLAELGYANLSHGYNNALGCEAVEFDASDCHIAVESDENGNIVKHNPSSLITFSGVNAVVQQAETSVQNPAGEGDSSSENMRTFKGFVRDARTQASAGVVTMEIYEGKQQAKGKLYTKIDTHSGGDFNVELPYGDYNIKFTSNKYITLVEEVTIRKTDSITVQDFYLSQENDKSNMFTIVLTWGSAPKDIDSYLIGTTSSGQHIKSWYGKKTNTDSAGNVISTLDIDITSGNGREITILYDASGNYTFYVKNFSKEAILGESGAEVRIYKGDSESLVETVTVPADFDADTWEVFTISDGSVNVTNKSGNIN